MDKIVIYTAIAGQGRDVLKDIVPIPGIKYVCFTDSVTISSVWEIRDFDFYDKNQAIKAKHPKVLPHKYFPDFDVSIWLDGNISPCQNIVSECMSCLSKNDIAAHRHPKRGSAYEEVRHIISTKTSHSLQMYAQVNKYKKLGMPENSGLWECGVLFRMHNKTNVKNAMELWWNEITENRQPRDQVSFPYVLWKTGLEINSIIGDLRKKDYIKYSKHMNAFKNRYSNLYIARREYLQRIVDKRSYKKTRTVTYA